MWLYCDADTAYMYQYGVYLGQQKNSEIDVGYDVVIKLCKDISGKITMSIVTTCLHLFSY